MPPPPPLSARALRTSSPPPVGCLVGSGARKTFLSCPAAVEVCLEEAGLQGSLHGATLLQLARGDPAQMQRSAMAVPQSQSLLLPDLLPLPLGGGTSMSLPSSSCPRPRGRHRFVPPAGPRA